jgi:hypothetical protein
MSFLASATAFDNDPSSHVTFLRAVAHKSAWKRLVSEEYALYLSRVCWGACGAGLVTMAFDGMHGSSGTLVALGSLLAQPFSDHPFAFC